MLYTQTMKNEVIYRSAFVRQILSLAIAAALMVIAGGFVNPAAAQKLKSESETALAEYERALSEARDRAQGIAEETGHRLNAEAEERRKALEGALNVQLAEAEKAIEATKKAAMANVHGIATEAAAAIVERLIGQAPPEKSVADVVADVLKR